MDGQKTDWLAVGVVCRVAPDVLGDLMRLLNSMTGVKVIIFKSSEHEKIWLKVGEER